MARLAAGVRRRKNGTLEKRFTVKGKRYSVYGRNQSEINEKEQRLRVCIADGGNMGKGEVRMDAYFEEWLEEKRLTVKPNTIRTYTSYYRPYIGPEFGDKYLKEIDRKQVLTFQKKMSGRLEASTNNIIITLLKIILNSAVKEKLITENPATNIKRIRAQKRASETYHRALTEEEQSAFMHAAKGNFYYEFLAFQLQTGLRLGEVGALYWNDVDWENNVIHVSRTITRTEDGRWCIGSSPKSEAGNREIPMNRQIRQVLQAQWYKKYDKSFCENNDLIFQTPHGKLIDNRGINKAIRAICNKMEKNGKQMDYFTSHALRDTFATRYIEQGGKPQTLKTILGHSSYSMTMDLYSHVMPNTRQEEMNRIKIQIGL